MALSSVSNNPRATWLEYLGLPEDLDEWTLVDVKYTVSAYLSPVEGAGVSVSDKHLVTRADFVEYLRGVGEPYRFMAVNRSRQQPSAETRSSSATFKVDLSNVPKRCFEADFDLSRPDTFAHFSPPDQTAAVAMITLEKLGGYLDSVYAEQTTAPLARSDCHSLVQVELTLLSEVSERSGRFFDALHSYDVLNGEVTNGCALIDALRQRLRALEANLVHKSLRLPTLVYAMRARSPPFSLATIYFCGIRCFSI